MGRRWREVEPKISPRCKDVKRVVGAESLAAEWEGAAKEEVEPKMVPENKTDKEDGRHRTGTKFESANLLNRSTQI